MHFIVVADDTIKIWLFCTILDGNSIYTNEQALYSHSNLYVLGTTALNVNIRLNDTFTLFMILFRVVSFA